jgi:NAD(P)-dependent dehydrogenase (short-subunit alcohol dehydrogenase family)
MRVNVTSPFVLAGEILPSMKEAGWRRIVSIGSLYSRFGVSHTAAYTTSKHAVLGFTRVLSAEGCKHGVTANCILRAGSTRRWCAARQPRSPSRAAFRSTRSSTSPSATSLSAGWSLQPEVGGVATTPALTLALPSPGQAINIDGGSLPA